MSNVELRCLDAFPLWLEQLPQDCAEVGELLAEEGLSREVKVMLAAALNYLFKSLDLIPDGVEDLGFLDDAFVLRSAAALVAGDLENPPPTLARLAKDAELIEEFLTDDAVRLQRYTESLSELTVRGRSPAEAACDETVRTALQDDVKSWAASYRAPSFARDEKNLVKLKSFLGTKLPS